MMVVVVVRPPVTDAVVAVAVAAVSGGAAAAAVGAAPAAVVVVLIIFLLFFNIVIRIVFSRRLQISIQCDIKCLFDSRNKLIIYFDLLLSLCALQRTLRLLLLKLPVLLSLSIQASR